MSVVDIRCSALAVTGADSHVTVTANATPSRVTSLSSLLVDRAAAADIWLDPDSMIARLREAPDDDLPRLYGLFRSIRERAWQCQALVVAEMMSRARHGDGTGEAIRESLGFRSLRTVQYKAAVGRLLQDPDCTGATVALDGPTWWRIAAQAEDPKAAILHAADEKARDPSYSTRQFEAEMRLRCPLTIERIILVCRGNEADRRAGERLGRQYGAAVELREPTGETVAFGAVPA